MRTFLLGTVLILTITLATAQTIDFSARVTYTFTGEPLEHALDTLSEMYNVGFSYSPELIPLDHEVYASVEEMEFFKALDELFEGTAVIYGFIGTQLVLSIDPDKPVELMTEPILEEPVASIEPVFEPRSLVFVPAIPRADVMNPPVPQVSSDVFSREYIRYKSDELWKQVESDMNAFRAQVTFVPPLQAITLPNSIAPVNLSLNVLVGINDNIEGFEVGGLVNITRGHMTGLQVAGLANGVRRSTRGFQVAGITNVTKDISDGMQVGGVVNVSKSGGDMFQVGGVANVASGSLLAQVGGVANTAQEVEGIQIAGVLNYARKVPVQIGLINVADTSEVSIGLLSFIKNGYQSIELGAEEIIHANLNIRLGQRLFYNILHVGATYDLSSWSFGYGVGTSFVAANGRDHVQLELMTRQISEDESWTDELNLLNQFRVTWDFKVGRNMSIALGPTINVMTSRRYDPETDSYGSSLPLYTIFDETFLRSGRDPLNVSGWLGFHAGVRVNFE